MKFLSFLCLSFLFFSNSTYGQRTIKGKVVTEDLEILPEVRIQNSDTVLLAKTDLNGNFEITFYQELDTLILSWLGMEWLTISLSKDCNYLEVIMMYDSTYDFMTANKMDQLRKKRFDKIPELHTLAFNKELFKVEKPCFKREFEPYKPVVNNIKKKRKK